MKKFLSFTVAEPSDIIREGMVAVLRKINGDFRVFEVSDMAQLENHLQMKRPDVLIVNPGFWAGEKAASLGGDMLCVALLTDLRDTQKTQGFDLSVSLYDDFEQLSEKLGRLKPTHQEDSGLGRTLSQREVEIVSYVVKGYTNKQIADKLCLSQHTVITHRRNIANKLQIHSSAGLTIYAIVNKLVTLEEVK